MLATEKAGARPGNHATALLAEADRLMTVCNSCRYCEGLCAVFPAMEMRRAFPDGDLNYLANLCHGCGACYVDCQFSPPHEFDVNVPRVLAQVRNDSYAAYAWPRVLAPAFARNGLVDQPRGGARRRGVHLWLCGLARPIRTVRHAYRARRVLQADAACRDGMAVRARVPLRDRRDGARPACLLARYRRSGGARWRLALAGDPRCRQRCAISMAAASAATITTNGRTTAGSSIIISRSTASRSASRRPAWRRSITTPSAASRRIRGGTCRWCSARVGGIGLIFGPLGLMIAKLRRDPIMVDEQRLGMDFAFLAMLFLTSLTGLCCSCCAPRLRCRCCSRCISASCSRCSSQCRTASLCMASIVSPRWCATPRSIAPS